jgi:hypothetical protein
MRPPLFIAADYMVGRELFLDYNSEGLLGKNNTSSQRQFLRLIDFIT